MARILVVDDDQMVRQTLRLTLERAGHSVRSARNGNEALDLARSAPFDLFIVDIIMPEKEGIQTIIELRQTNPQARIIAISGGGRAGNFDYLEVARRLGATLAMRKPFQPKQLIDAVAECLE